MVREAKFIYSLLLSASSEETENLNIYIYFLLHGDKKEQAYQVVTYSYLSWYGGRA